MKYEQCPNCTGSLGVPDKLRGQPVKCPVCHLEFVPKRNTPKRAKTAAKKNSPAKPVKPSLRSVPVPNALTSNSTANKNAKAEFSHAANQDDSSNQRLEILAPNSAKPTPSPTSKNKPIAEVKPTTVPSQADQRLKANPESTNPANPITTAIRSAAPAQPIVARIIKTEHVQPQLTKDGKLPTLLLVDETKPIATDNELKSNPVFIGLLICFSLLSSGLMLFFVGMQPSATEKRVFEAREKIRQFYEVRPDQEVAPYQRELREAQLAHSRHDYKAEIKFFENVMARFHAEDRNKFTGLTGSPTWDVELEEHVSVLLLEAKRQSR